MNIYCIAPRPDGTKSLLKLVRANNCLLWRHISRHDTIYAEFLIKSNCILDVKRIVPYFDKVSNFLESDLESPYVNL